MLDWSPEYPTVAARTYRDQFIAGAEVERLSGIPDSLLSRLIDAGIGHSWGAHEAGRVFARLYWKLIKRREWRNGGIFSETAYLIGAYEKELENLKKL